MGSCPWHRAGGRVIWTLKSSSCPWRMWRRITRRCCGARNQWNQWNQLLFKRQNMADSNMPHIISQIMFNVSGWNLKKVLKSGVFTADFLYRFVVSVQCLGADFCTKVAMPPREEPGRMGVWILGAPVFTALGKASKENANDSVSAKLLWGTS